MMLDGKGDGDSTHILKFIKSDTVGAEIGTWRGDTAAKMVDIGLKKLYIVDPHSIEAIPEKDMKEFINRYCDMVGSTRAEDFVEFYDNVHYNVIKRFYLHKEVVILRCLSDEFFSSVKEKLDWIYIDGDHSYEGTMADLVGAMKVLKDNGIILGDDFGGKPGVTKAVKEFCNLNKLKYETHGKRQYSIQL